ncbi:MAG: hypothetical protein OEY52_11465 [Gammaproteobacteria bacterium]|nr:hypothetical protein [Gammaproteobacteria bacterium]
MELKRQSVISCPNCGFEKLETMPVDACTWAWECPQCQNTLNPKQGDCCVFCSYGSVPCPSMQHVGPNRACN